jgi:hypothetical protein
MGGPAVTEPNAAVVAAVKLKVAMARRWGIEVSQEDVALARELSVPVGHVASTSAASDPIPLIREGLLAGSTTDQGRALGELIIPLLPTRGWTSDRLRRLAIADPDALDRLLRGSGAASDPDVRRATFLALAHSTESENEGGSEEPVSPRQEERRG